MELTALPSGDAFITLWGNCLWVAMSSFICLSSHALLRWQWAQPLMGVKAAPSALLVSFLNWTRLTALCATCHRLYWVLAVLLAPEWTTHAPIFMSWRHLTVVYVFGMLLGTYRSVVTLVPTRLKTRFLLGYCGWAGGWSTLALPLW